MYFILSITYIHICQQLSHIIRHKMQESWNNKYKKCSLNLVIVMTCIQWYCLCVISWHCVVSQQFVKSHDTICKIYVWWWRIHWHWWHVVQWHCLMSTSCQITRYDMQNTCLVVVMCTLTLVTRRAVTLCRRCRVRRRVWWRTWSDSNRGWSDRHRLRTDRRRNSNTGQCRVTILVSPVSCH